MNENNELNTNNSNDKFVISTAPINTNTTPVEQTQPSVNTQPVVQQQPSVELQQNTTEIPVDTNNMVNENLKKVEINYTPPSKAKVILLILFFIALIGFVLFLPEITAFVNKLRTGNLDTTEEKITSGRLMCSLNTNTTNLDKDYYLTFRFEENKLKKTEFVITTKGDITLDEETLDELNNTCKKLKENTKKIIGVTIQCNYTEGKLEEIQTFDLINVDQEKLNSAFSEAGGNNPEYRLDQDIDSIEKNMKASGYACKRER